MSHLVCHSPQMEYQVESWSLLSPVPSRPHTSNVQWSRGTETQNDIINNTKKKTRETPKIERKRNQFYLSRSVLSLCVTLRHVGSEYGMSLWTGGLHAVSVVLTVGFRTLWFVYIRKENMNKKENSL